MPRIVYCHGFGSSPGARKAQGLRAALEPEGFDVVAPDLNVPTFERLDWDATVACAAQAAGAAGTDLIVGSSLGALVALELSRRVPLPLVLVAPCLGFGSVWTPAFPPGDPVRFVDRDSGRERLLHRAFLDDMLRRPCDLDPPPAPVTVIMGRRDEAIPFLRVRDTFDRWVASGRLAPRSEFIDLPDGDHGLHAFLGTIADAVRRRAPFRLVVRDGFTVAERNEPGPPLTSATVRATLRRIRSRREPR